MMENTGVHTDHSSIEVRRNNTLAGILTQRFQHPLSQCRVLDVGCGHGALLGWFHERGVKPENLYGVGLLPNRIRIARPGTTEY
jgi:2-polyprenyl-3-methyl-5-hydroxy-6-metoxy-1,4-benzoquinol methylase